MSNWLSPDVLLLQERLSAAEHHVLAAEQRADTADAEVARVKAINADLAACNALLELQNAKMRTVIFGQRSERSVRLIDQLELSLEELEASASEDEVTAAEVARPTNVVAFERKRPSRKPLPDHLPRERVVIHAPTECPCCGSDKLSKLGEDITETLEVIPRQWKVVQTVREKFSCRECEKITQPPAPFHVTPRGMFGPSFLAMVLFEKFGQHQPLNRQSERYAREGVALSLSTLADQVGACAAALAPLHKLIEAHVLAAQRLHGDDTTVPVLAKLKTDIGRIWTYVRDDRPFGNADPRAALFYYSRDRRQEHPQSHLADYTGILQADANAQTKQRKTPLVSPMAAEAVLRIDALFDIERAINGKSAAERHAVRQEHSAPLVTALHDWMHGNYTRLSKHDPVAKAMSYMLSDWPAFTAFLDDGRICLTNNAAERALIGTAKLNDIDPQAWLADALARIANIPQSRLSELLPWNWQVPEQLRQAA